MPIAVYSLVIPEQAEDFLTELRVRAAMAADSVAVLSPGKEPVTFCDLVRQVDACARVFADLSLGREDIVAISLPDGVEFLLVLLGITGVAICAPLNPAFSETELRAHLMEIGPQVLVVENMRVPAAAIARELGIAVLEACHVLSEGGSTDPRGMPANMAANDVAVLLHTAATTGGAKLVPLTHLNLAAMAANSRAILGLSEADRFLSMMPMFHLQGLMSCIAQLLAGGSVISTAGFDARTFSSWLSELRPTWYTAGPALHTAILPMLAERTSLRFVRSIGAAMPPDLMMAIEHALGVPVLEGYGMTEAGMVTSNMPVAGGRKAGSVGKRGGVELGIFEDGQIALRGAAVTKQYWKDAGSTGKSFREGWFLTGDIGRLDDEGFLYITGRIKEMINRGGEKIAPAEVDAVLLAHPGVAEAAAFGVAHPTLGEEICAAVILRPEAIPTEAIATEPELRRFAAGRLALYKVPRRIIFVDAIPKGPTGKPKRDVLSRDLPVVVERTDGRATPVEKAIADIWKRVLGVSRLGVHDDFFSLGGDSFAATLMLTEVEQEFGFEQSQLDEADFFISPDVSTLARIVEAAGSGRAKAKPAIVALQTAGSGIPFFCFPGADENPFYFRLLAQRLGPDHPFLVVRDPRPLAERGSYTVEQAADRLAEVVLEAHEGPFVVGGHCYGGILAFEVARRLMASGAAVSAVVFMEVPTPGYPKVLRHWKDYARQFWSAMRRVDRAAIAKAGAHVKLLSGIFRGRMRRAGAGGAPLKEHPNTAAGRVYRPVPLDCDVVHMIAGDEPHSTLILDDPRLGWKEFTRGKFTLVRTPGMGRTFFLEPSVKELAAELRMVLAAAAKKPAESLRLRDRQPV